MQAPHSSPHSPLPPRHEAFCRSVARGATLASAAREAGYSPASARQRGSELYARDDVQQHIGRLVADRAEAEQSMREEFIRRFEMLFEECLNHGERGTAMQALKAQLHLRGLDARSLNRRDGVERDRHAQEAELHDRIRAELHAEIRAEVLDELERSRPAPHAQERTGAEQNMTNHVVSAKPAGPAGRGNSAALDAFIARHGLPALDAPVPTGPALEREVDALERALAELDREDRRGAHPLAKAGARLPGPRGRRARPEDATLPCLDGPCLDGPAGMTAAAGPGVAALPRR